MSGYRGHRPGTFLDRWGRLPVPFRQELVAAYDERWEERFFGPTPDREEVSAVVGGGYVPTVVAREAG